jgi:adenosylhomocysteine nucleosidase
MMESRRSVAFGFVCAMPMELTPLAEKLSLVEEQVGDTTVHAGKLGDHDVVAIVSGMGTAYAREGTERMLDAFAVAHVVSIGIMGGMENETPIGTVLLPEVVLHRGVGSEHRPTPLGDGTHAGMLATGDEFTTEDDYVAVLRGSGVIGLDMETAEIARVCEERGIPWSVFRAISDQPADAAVTSAAFELSNLDNTPNHEAIEKFFAERPEMAEHMQRLMENSTLAAEAAAQAAIDACLHRR